jgi:hypothetical protein
VCVCVCVLCVCVCVFGIAPVGAAEGTKGVVNG